MGAFFLQSLLDSTPSARRVSRLLRVLFEPIAQGRIHTALPARALGGLEGSQNVGVQADAGMHLGNGRLGSSSAHQLLALIEAGPCKPGISQLRRIVWITPGGFGNVLVRVHWLSLSIIPSVYLNVREPV
jgi:hypothetical protein